MSHDSPKASGEPIAQYRKLDTDKDYKQIPHPG